MDTFALTEQSECKILHGALKEYKAFCDETFTAPGPPEMFSSCKREELVKLKLE